MFKPIKATGKVAFVSDLHIQHRQDFIFEKRGFGSAEEHAQFIRDQWFELIDYETTVFNLGDSHFGDPTGDHFKNFTTWPCKVQYYLWGNHNSGAKQIFFENNKGIETYPMQVSNLVFVGTHQTAFINRKQYEMSHFPNRIWDKMQKGARHISGHSHGSDPTRNVDGNGGKCLDVGVENALKFSGKFFFTFEEVESILADKQNPILDHHHESNHTFRH